MSRRKPRQPVNKPQPPPAQVVSEDDSEPDWSTPCSVCEATPTVPLTGMCGPCTFGEADTVGGNW